MATSKAYTLSNLWDGINNGAAWDAGVVFNRTNALPLDKFSVFDSLSAANDYANNNAIAYPGQIITVVDNETSAVTVYKIVVEPSLFGSRLEQIDAKINVDDLPLSAGTAIDITPTGFINVKYGNGLSIDENNSLMIGQLVIDGGSSVEDGSAEDIQT